MSFIKYMSLVCLLFGNLVCRAEVPDFLRRLDEDPYSVSAELPEKKGALKRPYFDELSISKRSFVTIKDQLRGRALCTVSRPGEPCSNKNEWIRFEGISDEWRLRQFLGSNYESNILKLDSYNQGQLKVVPWTGYYWPMYEGGIGNRYGDAKFPRSQNFKINYEFYEQNYLKTPQADPETLKKLSPSEKYDYLLNDHNWNLTKAVWADGKSYMDSYGKVETWMGICHGWAPAAFSVPEPKKSISINLDSQRGELTLYPHDLKALISQLWAEVSVDYGFLGGRCDEKNPKTDEAGRIISSDCFDVNPAEWHMVLTNLLGKQQQSFVLDATYDYEVWNQPIYSYKLKYFNPNTRSLGTMRESIVSIADVKNDLYQKYRSSDAKYLIGVASDIQYVVEEHPIQSDSSHSGLNRLVSVTYYYDLELDADYNIIGGEWYQKAHPDILWKPNRGARPQVRGEDRFKNWEGVFPIPVELQQFAIKLSAYKTPLSTIINELTGKSNP